MRDTLNLIHDLTARRVGIRNLANPSKSALGYPPIRHLVTDVPDS